jgi:hypothetical protein
MIAFNTKQLKPSLITVFLMISTGIAAGRAVRIWPYQELLEKSDLVVIATPVAVTNDLGGQVDLPGFSGLHVVSVETTFSVSAVLKGEKTVKDLVLHHYSYPTNGGPYLVNSPYLFTFEPEANSWMGRKYMLFLTRETNGHYAPVVGQTDPGGAVREIGVEKTLTEQLTDVLRECEIIKPGMHREDLFKVFTTEGGLSTAKHRTYVHRRCPYIKVDVDFSLSGPKRDVLEERPTDTIVKISKPYLDWSIAD